MVSPDGQKISDRREEMFQTSNGVGIKEEVAELRSRRRRNRPQGEGDGDGLGFVGRKG